MTNPISMVRTVHYRDGDGSERTYTALMFVCPGCRDMVDTWGLHMLPVNSEHKNPQWNWDLNEEAPTLMPSILTKIHPYDEKSRPLGVCHSYLTEGKLVFLPDSTHPLAGQTIPLPPLPDWAVKDD